MTSFHVVVNLPRVLVAVETGVGLIDALQGFSRYEVVKKIVPAHILEVILASPPPPWPNTELILDLQATKTE